MTTYGVDTVAGFNLKRLNDIRSSLQALLNQIVDPDSGETLQINLQEDDPFVQVINTLIDQLSTTWELAQATYNQFNPLLAAGPGLSGLVQLNGITRKSGTASTTTLLLTGSVGLLIPVGSKVSDTNDEVIWALNADVYIGSDGTATAATTSTTNGAYVYAAGSLTKMVTIISGWDAATNIAETIPGTVDETDAALRSRRNISTTTPAQSVVEAIYGAILNIENVTSCRIYVNNTLTTDGNGLPAKSLCAVVIGGINADVARVIFERLAVAIYTYGNTSVTYVDTMQTSNIIRFTRPTPVPIFVEVNISIIDVNSYPADAVVQIKNNIAQFALYGIEGLGVVETNVFDQSGYLPGDDVVVSKLYPPINAVLGLKINSVQIGLSSGTLGSADIAVVWDHIATFSTSNITVNVS